jgi:hypothetical protein
LNELVAYWLHFEGYKYDRFTNKLVEIHVDVFEKSSHVQSAVVATSFESKFFVATIKELEPIRGGVELAIVPYTLPSPINLWKYLLFLTLK